MRPRVSILVCTRNRARSLSGTLESLAAIQSDIPWEAVLLDNASTDDTADILKAACARNDRLRYAYEAQLGLGAARDSGWRQCEGDIVALSDDDCYFDPDYVDNLVKVFEEHPQVGVVGGRILLFDPDDAPLTIDLREEPDDIAPYSILRTGALHGANLAFRKVALEKAGGFDRRLGAGTPFPAEDIDAAAAVVWSGFAGRYDPRPIVHHHHGRKTEDMAAQFQRYDRGRGAYYAKYVVRADTRRVYLADWRERCGPLLRMRRPHVAAAEMMGALGFVFRHEGLWRKLVFGGAFLTVWVSARVQLILRKIRKRLKGAQAGAPA